MRLVIAALLALASQATRVDAQDHAPPATPGVESYRLQTLGADALAAGLVVAAIGVDQETVMVFAAPAYFLIPPVMHWSKDRPDHALASVSNAGRPPTRRPADR